MNVLTTLRPYPVVAARGPVHYHFRSQRHLLSAGSPTIYEVLVRGVPPIGSQVWVAGIRLRWLSAAAGYDAFNPHHIDAAFATTPHAVALRVQAAIHAHPAFRASFWPATVLQVGNERRVLLSTRLPTMPTGTTQATDATGNVFSSTTDPWLAYVTFAGSLPVLREGYALRLQLWMEARHRQDAEFSALPILRLPTPDNAAEADFAFRIESLLQLPLGFDVPAPQATQPLPALRALRQAKAEWAEQFAPAETNGRWFADIADDQPYSFLALDAEVDEWEALPHLAEDASGCPESSPQLADVLLPYYLNGNQPVKPLHTADSKPLYLAAPEYFCFLAHPDHPRFQDAENLRMMLDWGDGPVVMQGLDVGLPPICRPAHTFLGHAWIVPLQPYWARFPLQHANEVKVWLASDSTINLASGFGSFEGGSPGLVPALGAAQLSLFSALSPVQAGTSSLGIGIYANNPANTVALLESPLPLSWDADVLYEASLWVWVEKQGLGSLLQSIRFELPGTQAEVVADEPWAHSMRGFEAWKQVRLRFRPRFSGNGKIALRLDWQTEPGGEAKAFFDSLKILNLEPLPLTQKAAYRVKPACPQPRTFLFQGRLGLPETLHCAPQTEIRLVLQRTLAGAIPSRTQPLAPDAALRQLPTNATLHEKVDTFFVAEALQPLLAAFLKSPHTYVLSEPGPAGERQWLPIVLEETQYVLKPAERGASRVRFAFRMAR